MPEDFARRYDWEEIRMLQPLDQAAGRVQRWRRNSWYANETRGKDADFKPVVEFRR